MISCISILHAFNADLSLCSRQVVAPTQISCSLVIWCYAMPGHQSSLPLSLYCPRSGPLKTVNLCMTNPHKDMISFFTHFPKKIPGFHRVVGTCIFIHASIGYYFPRYATTFHKLSLIWFLEEPGPYSMTSSNESH